MPENSGHISALLTDLYELTMAASYFREKMFQPATFSLFIRRYPPNWAYFVNAGLDAALDYVESFRFSSDDIRYLHSTNLFADDFLDFLAGLRFTGDVRAMKEGEIFFADEPILEVIAPIIEAQLLETRIINIMHLHTLICTKAARCTSVSQGKTLIDFSLRRTHGAEAGIAVARSSHIAGFSATSNVLAGRLFGIPISGTMAHSYINAFEDETEAFRAFARSHPDNTILLVDTYDTLSGVEKACIVGREMQERGLKLKGIRLDSGDMINLSRQARKILDGAGLTETRIFASSGFDEYKISEALQEGAEIDGFGVGTNMGVSKDSPYMDMAYKLVEYDGRPVLKLSENKATLPGGKQVYRAFESDGTLKADIIALRDEKPVPDAIPLLQGVMSKGGRIFRDSLPAIRNRCTASLKRVPAGVAAISNPGTYPVLESEALQTQKNLVTAQLK